MREGDERGEESTGKLDARVTMQESKRKETRSPSHDFDKREGGTMGP